jgi:DNA transposition AAA+ family ATPase
MQEGKLVMIGNVKKSLQAIEYLKRRPKREMVGLGLLYGEPGLGKTRFAQTYAIQQGWIYIRLESGMTARVFRERLLRHIDERTTTYRKSYNLTSSTLLWELVAQLTRHDIQIMVDEIDYGIDRMDILNTIRDLVDQTETIIVMCGEETSKSKLLERSPRYFDRCNAFVRFERLTVVELQEYVRSVSDVEIDAGLMTEIMNHSRGYLRRIVKRLTKIEMMAQRLGKKSVTIGDWNREQSGGQSTESAA